MGSGKGFPRSGAASGKGTLSTPELAAALGISRQRVNELGRTGKISREKDGRWDPEKVAAALGRNLDGRQSSPARDRSVKAPHTVGQHRSKGKAEKHPPKGTLLYEQWRLTKEKADTEAMNRETEAGQLLKRDETKAAVSAMISASKNKLVTIADELCDKLAATSDPVHCRELVDGKIHQALSELAEWPASA